MASFKQSARSLDQGVGAVLHGLHELGLTESTLVICTTDHGIAFPGAKATLFDRGIGVMMIMRGPAGFTGGKVIDSMVTHLDVYPTLCDARRARDARLGRGRVADAARRRQPRADPRADLRRDDLSRRLPAASRRSL